MAAKKVKVVKAKKFKVPATKKVTMGTMKMKAGLKMPKGKKC